MIEHWAEDPEWLLHPATQAYVEEMRANVAGAQRTACGMLLVGKDREAVAQAAQAVVFERIVGQFDELMAAARERREKEQE